MKNAVRARFHAVIMHFAHYIYVCHEHRQEVAQAQCRKSIKHLADCLKRRDRSKRVYERIRDQYIEMHNKELSDFDKQRNERRMR